MNFIFLTVSISLLTEVSSLYIYVTQIRFHASRKLGNLSVNLNSDTSINGSFFIIHPLKAIHANVLFYLYKEDKRYHLIQNSTVDVCKLIDKKSGSRLFQYMAQSFYKRMNRELTCPVKTGNYVFKNYRTDEISLPPILDSFVNSKGRLEMRFYCKQRDILEFWVFLRYDVLVRTKVKRNKVT